MSHLLSKFGTEYVQLAKLMRMKIHSKNLGPHLSVFHFTDGGGLMFPTVSFVGTIQVILKFVESTFPKTKSQKKCFVSYNNFLTPYLISCQELTTKQFRQFTETGHSKKLVTTILIFLSTIIDNNGGNKKLPKSMVQNEPGCRKILKIRKQWQVYYFPLNLNVTGCIHWTHKMMTTNGEMANWRCWPCRSIPYFLLPFCLRGQQLAWGTIYIWGNINSFQHHTFQLIFNIYFSKVT